MDIGARKNVIKDRKEREKKKWGTGNRYQRHQKAR